MNENDIFFEKMNDYSPPDCVSMLYNEIFTNQNKLIHKRKTDFSISSFHLDKEKLV
jgi:hypothetical protein